MKILKLILGLIAAPAVVVSGFIWGYAPLRDGRLELKNTRFTLDFRLDSPTFFN